MSQRIISVDASTLTLDTPRAIIGGRFARGKLLQADQPVSQQLTGGVTDINILAERVQQTQVLLDKLRAGIAESSALPIYDDSGRVIADRSGFYVYDQDGNLVIDANEVQINTDALVDAAITTAKLAPLSVNSEKLSSLAVTAAKLADSSVTATKIANAAVGTAAIGTAAVGTAQIADAAITTALIGDLQVVDAKIASLSGTKITANSITASKIAAGTITANEIAAGTITANEIAAGTITASKIASDTITASQIAAGAITSSELSSSSVTAGAIAAGAVTAVKINVATLSAISANIGTITAGTINGISLTGNTITGGTIAIGTNAFEVNSTGSVFWQDAFGGDLFVDDTSPSPSIPLSAIAFGNREAIRGRINNTNNGVDAHAIRGENLEDNTSGLVGPNNGFDFYANGGGTDYGPFTGGHQVLLPNTEAFDFGDIVVDVEIKARKGWSNTLFAVERSSSPNQKGVVGVVISSQGSLANGKMVAALIDREEHRQVGTTPRGKPITERITHRNPVFNQIKDSYQLCIANALGEGQMNVCGEGGDISVGDLIVTSSLPGKGMKQADDIIRSYTVAKAREAVTFSGPTDVKVVACIYLAG